MTQPTTALDWDAWRNAYPTLTYQEQQAFHTAIYAQYPEQRHYDSTYVAKAIEDTNARTVVELGGWDGELAEHMLTVYPTISEWTNVELCREAADAGKDRHPRYTAAMLDDWYWTRTWTCDLFIASHSIEHLTASDLEQTIASTNARALFFDAPLENYGLNWNGFTGSHILEIGWTGIGHLCKHHGYKLAWSERHNTDPSSGGQATACLYVAQGG